ncbi:hypothetical protein SCHPADRAFT_550286 [Schizopora paradoxa]|uniref:Uncharacterized protein n=1 Tax=Schizopora paradoxa TaxID=27342 RepID=A0A0H2RJZ4_9AGAM|nr:hypothetical protein SCHPADRAFT_550286 [Schizopora paradoxa]
MRRRNPPPGHGGIPPAPDSQLGGNQFSNATRTGNRQSSAPPQITSALSNRSSSQPYHAHTNRFMQRDIRHPYSPFPNIHPIETSRRQSSHSFRQPIAPTRESSFIAQRVPRGRSESVHQLQQSERFDRVSGAPRHEQTANRQHLEPSPAGTSDSATLNGDEDAVFEDSDESEEEEEEEEDEESYGQDENDDGQTDSQFDVQSADLHPSTSFSRQFRFRAGPRPPFEDYAPRRGSEYDRGVHYGRNSQSSVFRNARTGSFSGLETSSSRERFRTLLNVALKNSICVRYRLVVGP